MKRREETFLFDLGAKPGDLVGVGLRHPLLGGRRVDVVDDQERLDLLRVELGERERREFVDLLGQNRDVLVSHGSPPIRGRARPGRACG